MGDYSQTQWRKFYDEMHERAEKAEARAAELEKVLYDVLRVGIANVEGHGAVATGIFESAYNTLGAMTSVSEAPDKISKGGTNMRTAGESPDLGEVRRHCVPGTRPDNEEKVDRLKVNSGLADPDAQKSARVVRTEDLPFISGIEECPSDARPCDIHALSSRACPLHGTRSCEEPTHWPYSAGFPCMPVEEARSNETKFCRECTTDDGEHGYGCSRARSNETSQHEHKTGLKVEACSDNAWKSGLTLAQQVEQLTSENAEIRADLVEARKALEARAEMAVLPAYPGPLTMTKDEVLERLCDMLFKVWESFDPNAHEPNDCFCPKANPTLRFQTAAQPLRWVESLVSDALRRRSLVTGGTTDGE
jgi:hypothetical protein